MQQTEIKITLLSFLDFISLLGTSLDSFKRLKLSFCKNYFEPGYSMCLADRNNLDLLEEFLFDRIILLNGISLSFLIINFSSEIFFRFRLINYNLSLFNLICFFELFLSPRFNW